MKYNSLLKPTLVVIILLIISNLQAVEVTFRVDMSEETVAAEGIHIAGNFQGWDPAATEMTLTVDNIYVYTTDFDEGENLEFKYVNGNFWGLEEMVPAGCALNGNRFLTVPATNTELEAVCFGSCIICNPTEVEITFQVDMSNETVSANGVHVAGSFQFPPWQPGATEMQLVGDNVYAVTLALGIGDYHEYKFINGNVWGDDETVPPDCSVGFNRYITIPEVPTTIEAVCFGSCYPCGPTPIDINVTFQVDMSEQIISPDGIHIGGAFQGWDPAATEMTDAGDNIYTYTTVLSSGTYQEYKYVNGTTWEEAEDVPVECGANNNRYITLPWNDTVIDIMCYGECGPCAPPPVDVDVTLQVDMSNEDIAAEGIHVTGTFQGWDPSGTPLTDLGDDKYAVTVTMPSGLQHEYKFINGNTFDDVETVPIDCAQNSNRYFTVPTQDTTMVAVCFGSCDPCGQPPVDVEITFRVDMANETVSAEGVHIAGSFQNWQPDATEMLIAEGDIYAVTITLSSGSAQEYKFINGNTWENVEIVPAECANGGNRYYTVPDEDETLEAVCFGSCDTCIIIAITNPDAPDNAFDFYPNPTDQSIYFYKASTVSVYSVDGKLIRKEIIYNNMMDVSSLQRGLYYICIENKIGSKFRKLIIK